LWQVVVSWFRSLFTWDGVFVAHWFLYEEWWFHFEVPLELVIFFTQLFNGWVWWIVNWWVGYLTIMSVVVCLYLCARVVDLCVRLMAAVVEWLSFGLLRVPGVLSRFSLRLVHAFGRALAVVKRYQPWFVFWVVLKTLVSLTCVLVCEVFWAPFDVFRVLMGAVTPWSVGWDGGRVLVRGAPGVWFSVDTVVRRYRFQSRPVLLLCVFGFLLNLGYPSLRLVWVELFAPLPLLLEEAVLQPRVELVFCPAPFHPVLAATFRGFYLGLLFSYTERHLLAASLPYLEGEELLKDHNASSSVREWEALARGKALANIEGVALVAACGSAGAVPRLRARGRFACRLQTVLGGARGVAGSFVRGRWTPDLPSADRTPTLNALLAVAREELKVLGVGTFPTKTGRDGDYVLVESRDGERRLMIPNLLGRLSTYAALRARDEDLLLGLRARAVTWFKDVEAPAWVAPLCLSSCVADAFGVSRQEEAAWARLRGTAAVEHLVGF